MAKKVKNQNGNTYVQKKPFYKRVWFWVLAIILLFGGISAMSGGSSDSSSSSSSSKASSDPFSKVFKVGQTASYKGYQVKVNKVSYNSGDDIDQPDSGKQYIVVNVTITNKTDDSQDYNPLDFKLNANGNSTDLDEVGDTNVDNRLESGKLDKGASVTGNLVGQVDPNTSKLQLQYKPSFWNDQTVKFDLKN